MKTLIKSLYPVKYDGMIFIYAGKGSILMDLDVRMRGWGWIQYLGGKLGLPTNACEIQDNLGEFIAQAINEKIERDIISK